MSIAAIENERCTLEVVGNAAGKWAHLNLDIFFVKYSKGTPLEMCEEIEIVSAHATVVADLSEILAASFNPARFQAVLDRPEQVLLALFVLVVNAESAYDRVHVAVSGLEERGVV